ncbi:MAG: NAD-dependent epimerase/dehydratase family protein, partial [Polyangiales bacterium]
MSARPLPADDLEAITTAAEADLRALEGAHLLITGASGMFGRWLLSSFAHANRTLGLRARCTAVARRARVLREIEPALSSDPAIELVDGDVRDWAPRADATPTHVIHAATSTSATVSASETIATIVDGTRNVLARGSASARLLYVSSGAVYGSQPTTIDRVAEGHLGAPDPLDVRSAYGEAKRLAEQCCVVAVAERGMSISIARGFAFAG